MTGRASGPTREWTGHETLRTNPDEKRTARTVSHSNPNQSTSPVSAEPSEQRFQFVAVVSNQALQILVALVLDVFDVVLGLDGNVL